MLDAEDKAIVVLWTVRLVACVVLVLSLSASLGLAWRIFDLVRG